MDYNTEFKNFGIAFIIWWVICAVAGLGLFGLIIYILYRLAVMLS